LAKLAGTDRQRVDKWLFFARVAKSRSLATALVESGCVRVNRGKISQPGHGLKVGDVLTITLDRRVLVLRLHAFGKRRGPASEARLLYEDLVGAPRPPDGSLSNTGGGDIVSHRSKIQSMED